VATGLAEPVDGFIEIPDAPGIGLELVPDVEKRFPPKPRPIRMRPHMDGSVVDQ
jgi:galactonate dehydratase